MAEKNNDVQEQGDREFFRSAASWVVAAMVLMIIGAGILLGIFTLLAYARDATCIQWNSTYLIKAIVDCAVG